MNLAKNGAVLLAALSVFAMTSCGSKTKTMTLADGMEWLKDVKEADGDAKIIKAETYKWDLSVTGKGMLPTGDPKEDPTEFIPGGAQYLVAYLISEDGSDYKPEQLIIKDELQPLKSSFEDDSKQGRKASSDEMAFATAETFAGIVLMRDCYGHKIYTQNNMLYVTFNRVEEIDTSEGEILLDFKQEVAIKKDGFVDHYSVTTNKLALKMSNPKQGIDIDGTLSGRIDVTFSYKE